MYNNFRSSVFNITAVNIWTMYVWTMVVWRTVSGLYHQQKPCTVQIWITSQISRNVNFIKIVLEPWKTTDLCTFLTSILDDGWFSVTPSCKLLENWRPARRATDAEKTVGTILQRVILAMWWTDCNSHNFNCFTYQLQMHKYSTRQSPSVKMAPVL